MAAHVWEDVGLAENVRALEMMEGAVELMPVEAGPREAHLGIERFLQLRMHDPLRTPPAASPRGPVQVWPEGGRPG